MPCGQVGFAMHQVRGAWAIPAKIGVLVIVSEYNKRYPGIPRDVFLTKTGVQNKCVFCSGD